MSFVCNLLLKKKVVEEEEPSAEGHPVQINAPHSKSTAVKCTEQKNSRFASAFFYAKQLSALHFKHIYCKTNTTGQLFRYDKQHINSSSKESNTQSLVDYK